MVVPSMRTCPVCGSAIGGSDWTSPPDDATVPVLGAEALPPPSTSPPPGPIPGSISAWPADGPAPAVDAFGGVGPTGTDQIPVIGEGIVDPVAAGSFGAVPPPGGEYPAATPGSGASHPRRGKVLVGIGGAALVLLLVAAGLFAWHTMDAAHAMDVTMEPIGKRTDHPFTASVSAIPVKAARAFASQSTSGTPSASVRGDNTGLYGGWKKSVCDKDRLVELVTSDDALARAWASGEGIEPSAISREIRSLTAVLLAGDTAVTDHRYLEGRSDGFPAILQRGTSVLVDAYGTPKVRCLTGDPLGTPTFTSTSRIHPVGPTWSSYEPRQVLHITPATAPMGTITTVPVDPRDQQTESRDQSPATSPPTPAPAKTKTLDGVLDIGPSGVSVVDKDGSSTKVISDQVADARDDGAGGILYQQPRTSGEDISASSESSDSHPDDLIGTVPADADEASIWQLGAGQSKATRLIESGDPGNHWFAMLATGTIGGDRVLVYADIRRDSGAGDDGSDALTGSLRMEDLDTKVSSAIQLPPGVLGAQGAPIDSVRGVTIAHDSVLIGLGDAGTEWYLAKSTGGGKVGTATQVTTDGWPGAVGMDDAGLTDDGQFVGLLPHQGSAQEGSGDPVQLKVRDLPSGQVVKTIEVDEVPGPDGDAAWPSHWDVSGDIAIGTFAGALDDTDQDPTAKAIRIDLTTGQSTELDLQGRVRVLRHPVIRPSADDVDRTTTTVVSSDDTACPSESDVLQAVGDDPDSATDDMDGVSVENVTCAGPWVRADLVDSSSDGSQDLVSYLKNAGGDLSVVATGSDVSCGSDDSDDVVVPDRYAAEICE